MKKVKHEKNAARKICTLEIANHEEVLNTEKVLHDKSDVSKIWKELYKKSAQECTNVRPLTDHYTLVVKSIVKEIDF